MKSLVVVFCLALLLTGCQTMLHFDKGSTAQNLENISIRSPLSVNIMSNHDGMVNVLLETGVFVMDENSPYTLNVFKGYGLHETDLLDGLSILGGIFTGGVLPFIMGETQLVQVKLIKNDQVLFDEKYQIISRYFLSWIPYGMTEENAKTEFSAIVGSKIIYDLQANNLIQ